MVKMATYTQLMTIARDTGFQGRVRLAMMSAALAVYNESASAQGHAARALYATKILAGSFDLNAAAYTVLTNPTIATAANPATTPDFAIADNDIQFQVNSMWNAMAGA